MTKKMNENRVVYAALILVLTVLSLIVIATGIASRRNDSPKDTEAETVTETEGKDVDAIITTKPKDTSPETVKRDETSETKMPETEKPTDVTVENNVNDVVATPALPEFTSPVSGNVVKEHSETVLVYSITMGDYRTHSGIDVETAVGADVRAVADGVIGEVWEDPMWGYCISILHQCDAVSYYKNLTRESLLAVSPGDGVKRGQLIATVGESALMETADEPHLHFELKIAGESVDPMDYFEVTGSEASPE